MRNTVKKTLCMLALLPCTHIVLASVVRQNSVKEKVVVEVEANYSDSDQKSPSEYNTIYSGDVNHDGSITMADANAVVNYYLATDKPADFEVKTADVNGDGQITMADANMIVNMFLEGEK